MARPRIDEDYAQEVYTIRLSPRLARMARKLGENNLSAGIRKCIEDSSRPSSCSEDKVNEKCAFYIGVPG